MIRIGLTGGIASGKTTVSSRLRELGAFVIDYDLLAREAVAPGSPGLRRIVDCFGPEAMASDGGLDRAWMARRVFSDSAPSGSLRTLEGIEHPLIFARAHELESAHVLADPHAVVVHDIPLLAEVIGSLPFRFDVIVTVEAPSDVRFKRLLEVRGMGREQARERLAHETGEDARRRMSTEVIDSTQSVEHMFERVDMLYAQWARKAKNMQ